MKKTIVAFIKLGCECSGREVGEYGQFEVELSAEEQAQIDEVVNSGAKGYLRNTLKERYPELDRKIVDAAHDLVFDIWVEDGVCELKSIGELESPVSIEDHEDAVEVAKQYDFAITEDVIAEADVCYYLTKEEIPDDYEG